MEVAVIIEMIKPTSVKTDISKDFLLILISILQSPIV